MSLSPLIPTSYDRGCLILASALTPLHAGSGRGYGLVDLPVQRDVMEYPIIYSSSFKGALKTNLVLRLGEEAAKGWLGTEPEERPSFPGLAQLHDLVPIAIPVPSASHGFVYVTTPYLLSRLCNYLEALRGLKYTETGNYKAQSLKGFPELVENLYAKASQKLKPGTAAALSLKLSGDIYVGTIKLRVEESEPGKVLSDLGGVLKGLNKLYEYKGVFENLIIVDDVVGRSFVNKAIQVVYRVRLDRLTKTVEKGALWSEEYLPYGALFAGLLLYKSYEEKGSAFRKALEERLQEARTESEKQEAQTQHRAYKEAWERKGEFFDALNGYLILGGKETIGRGLMKLMLAHPEELEGSK